MTFKKIAALFIVTVLVAVSFVWLRASLRERKRQANYRATVAMYSRDLPLGITRDAVEKYILIHGAKPESDQQPTSPNAHDIMVRLGEQPPPWYCNRVIVFL